MIDLTDARISLQKKVAIIREEIEIEKERAIITPDDYPLFFVCILHITENILAMFLPQ